MFDIKELYDKINIILKNYKKIYNLIFLYKDELLNILNDKNIIDQLNDNINKKYIDKLILKLDKRLNQFKELDILLFLKINKNIIHISKYLKNNILLIKEIDIYEKNIIISDTTKNNINQNKILIIDLYKKYKYHNIKLLNELEEELLNNINLKENYNNIFDIVSEYLLKHIDTINFYNKLIKYIYKLDLIDLTKILNKINYINNKIKIDILQKNLKHNNIKYNINKNLFNNNKLYNSNYYQIKNIKLLNNYNTFTYIKTYKNLSDVFQKVLNINKYSNILDTDYKKISEIINLYYKIDKENIIIVLINSNIDNILYNLSLLLDQNKKIESNSGINDLYINKTQTILTKSELTNNLIDSRQIYLSNINNITIIHNKLLYNKNKLDNNTLSELYNTNVLLINNIQNNYITFSNNIHDFIKLRDIEFLLLNESNYNIENYNSIINHEIINKINTFNIYDKYNENIKKSYNIYSNINHIEFKNILINKIKSIKLKINRENKEKIINLILQYINIELFNYINKSTNITLDSEIYFIYLSNINSLLNKIKKDILDNYNDQLLINIDNIINDQYHNIQSIIENILDKYYLLNI